MVDKVKDKKKPKMDGHIIKRGKNSFSIKVSDGKDSNGKYLYRWESVKGNKADAKKHCRDMQTRIDNGTYIQPTKTTLAEYLDTWLKDYARPNLAPRTAEGYEHIIRRHIAPSLGHFTLTQLKPEH